MRAGAGLGRMAPAGRELRGQVLAAQCAGERRGAHDPREGHVKDGDGHETGDGDRPQQRHLARAAQRAAADSPHGLQHDGRDGGLDAVEHAGHPAHVAERHVDPAQRDEDEQRGQHEQPARHDAARGAVHQPADVGGQLLRLGPGQQHAVVERVQEAPLGNPALLLDQLAVHDRDLAGGPAEADEAQPEPEPEGLAQRHVMRGGGSGGGCGHHGAAPFIRSGFQLCGSPCASRHHAYSAS